MIPTFTYAATVERVVDGDTIDVDLDLGMRIHVKTRLRIAHVDCPEMNTDAGKAAKAFVIGTLDRANRTVTVQTYKPDKYGRALADVFYLDMFGAQQNLATQIIDNGYGVTYEGGTR